MKKNDLRYEKMSFLSALVAGLAAHLYVFTHNFQIHDNVYNFYLGGTLNLGRWTLFLMNSLMNKVTGNYYHYQSPFFIGILSLCFLSLSAALVTNMLGLNRKLSAIAVGAILVTFPAVTSMYGYMFTAGLYSFGFFLTVLGVRLIMEKKWYFKAFGVLLAATGVGTYQVFVSLFLALFLILFFEECRGSQENKPAKKLCLSALLYILETALIMGLYYLILKLCLIHYHVELSDYRGMSSGNSALLTYLSRIGTAYRNFFLLPSTATDNMYPGSLRILYFISLILSLAAVLFLCIHKFRKNKISAIFMLLSAALLPLAFNFVYVETDSDIYSLMMFGESFLFVWLADLSDDLACSLELTEKPALKRVLLAALPVLVLAFSFFYIRLSNICYLKADEVQTAAGSYFTRLVLKIESVEGYTEDTKVCFVNYTHAADDTAFSFSEYDNEVTIFPYTISNLTTDYNWLNLMTELTGFAPEYAESAEITDQAQIEAMPSYPDEGSVAMVDGVVVVKFKEAE